MAEASARTKVEAEASAGTKVEAEASAETEGAEASAQTKAEAEASAETEGAEACAETEGAGARAQTKREVRAHAQMKEEYDTQFFGFSPIAYTDKLYSAVSECMDDAKEALKVYLCEKFSDDMPPSEIESATEALFATFEEPRMVCFDRLEAYLTTDILHVPDHVLLPEDAVHAAPPSLLNVDLDEEIEALENRIIAEKQKMAQLKGELETQETTIANLNAYLDDINESKIEEFKENVVYCVNKAKEILDRLADEQTDEQDTPQPETAPKSVAPENSDQTRE